MIHWYLLYKRWPARKKASTGRETSPSAPSSTLIADPLKEGKVAPEDEEIIRELRGGSPKLDPGERTRYVLLGLFELAPLAVGGLVAHQLQSGWARLAVVGAGLVGMLAIAWLLRDWGPKHLQPALASPPTQRPKDNGCDRNA